MPQLSPIMGELTLHECFSIMSNKIILILDTALGALQKKVCLSLVYSCFYCCTTTSSFSK